jgi:hypothetical protein
MIRIVLPLLLVTTLAAGCTATTDAPTAAEPAGPVAGSTGSTGPATHPAETTAPPAVVATVDPWSTAAVSVVHHPHVPPVPVLTGVRYARHAEGYDRIVLDIPGALPGYSARYVTEVRGDGSGRPIAVPGSHYLRIVLTPAQAHRDTGGATVSGVHRVGLPVLESYAVTGDYEGYVTVVLGLNRKAGYRIAELDNRIYVDVHA